MLARLMTCLIQSTSDVRFRYQSYPPEGENTLGRIDVFMLLDLIGTNNPEPTIVSSQQSTHVSIFIL